MDRMTRWNGSKYVLPQGHGVWRQIAERLAAYENTGLEPAEIEALKIRFQEDGCNPSVQPRCDHNQAK